MAAGEHGPETMARYSEAQARLEHAGGYGVARELACGTPRAWLRRRPARPSARHVLRRGAHAGVAGTSAGGRPRPAASRRADQPPRRAAARVAGEDPGRARCGRRARRARPLVPRGGRDGGARARGRPLHVLPRRVARVAAREGGADAGRLEVDRALQRRHRAAPALRRPVPVQEVEGEAGAGEAHPHRAAAEGEGGRLRRARPAVATLEAARLRVPEPAAKRAGGGRGRRAVPVGRREASARRRLDGGRARRARRPRRAERLGEDDAPGDDARTAVDGCRGTAARPRRRPRVLLAARGRARRARLRARVRSGDDRAAAPGGAEPARALPLLRLGVAREAGRGAVGRRAAASRPGRGRRLGRELPDPRRADQPPRPGEPRGARGCAGELPGDRAARLPRPRPPRRGGRAHARDRGRHDPQLRRRVGGLCPEQSPVDEK